MYDDDDDGPRRADFEIPWLGFVDVTSATLASIMILVMVFGLSAALTMAQIQKSERELYKTGLIYPFDEYREYEVKPYNGWSRGAGQELIYRGKWGVPVLDNGGDQFINSEIVKWNTNSIDLNMTIFFNPTFTFHGAALETGYEEVNRIRQALASLGLNVKVAIDIETTPNRKVGEIAIALTPTK